MTYSDNFVVLIPARGGSKRFPGKNVYPLLGKPLISYPISAALGAKSVDRVIVSTDDDKIAAAAKDCGAEVPFMRPADLAGDISPVIEAIKYTVEQLEEKENYRVDYSILLQAATPLIASEQIEAAIALALEKKADSVVTVSLVDTINHPYNVRKMNEDGTIGFWQEELHYQDIGKSKPKFYHAANLWLTSRETLLGSGRLEGKRNYPIVVPPIYSMDIDYKEDLELIEAYLSHKNKK
ncbi:acylneuraminate cytidylyltransferase family protein [Candidatus Uhrbacteria bacterium]|nr:acylneuraminate cytidylyltransferase family protein [Candidatus Uhrbacteria bacterium]